MDTKNNPIPLVLLHGFLGTKADWDPVCSHLEEFECILGELPGHGKTPFTKDFFNLIPALPKMHLIGYSMGGRLAMQYAQAFEDRIASLTILSAHRGLQDGKEKRLMLDQQWSKKIVGSFDDFLEEWYNQSIFGGFKPDFAMRKKHNPTELVKALNFYSLGNQDLLKPKNALFVVGEKDTKYRKLYPDATVVPDAYHMVHLENPKFIADVIRNEVDHFQKIRRHQV